MDSNLSDPTAPSPTPMPPPLPTGTAGTPAPVPPVLVPPAAEAASRPARNGWRTVAILLFCVLGLAAFTMAGRFVQRLISGGGHHASGAARTHLLESVYEDNGSRNKILLMDLSGIISGDPLDGNGNNLVGQVQDQLALAAEDEHVLAVVLRVDSPGGEVLASDEVSRAIREFQEETRKPVIASMGSVAASGGYYVAAPCRWIVANELTLTGSIGVILHTYNYRGLMDKVGVRPEVFKSGRFKDMLSPDKPPDEVQPEERKMMQELVDEAYTRFKQVVADGRAASNKANGSAGRKLAPNWVDLADGRVLSGRSAFEAGFVDELGTFDDAVDRALGFVGVERANLIQYHMPFSLGSFFNLFGKSEQASVKVDLGFDLPRLRLGKLYFLAPTVSR